jgi:predicted transcriptional regulator
MVNAIVVRKFAEGLEEIVNCVEAPEERLAELLVSMGLLEKGEEGYKLTEVGKKFLKLPIEA